jgi:hypothetical protein
VPQRCIAGGWTLRYNQAAVLRFIWHTEAVL